MEPTKTCEKIDESHFDLTWARATT